MMPRSWMRRVKGVIMKMPMMITCRQFEDFIIDYLEGTLPERQRKRFEFHMKICRECKEYLAAYKASMEAARQGMTDSELADLGDVPEDLISAVIASRN